MENGLVYNFVPGKDPSKITILDEFQYYSK